MFIKVMKNIYDLFLNKNKANDLLTIFQFGLIKVAPGVINLAMIPYLIFQLGSGQYGVYSLYLGYAMLCTTVLTAVLTQPMYRFLSSRENEESMFNFLMLLLCLANGLITYIIVLLHNSSIEIALAFGLYSAGALLSGFIGVKFQINKKISYLAIYEALRISIFLGTIIYVIYEGLTLNIKHLLFGLIISNIIPFFIFSRNLNLRIFKKEWFFLIISYGSKSSLWLLLAGIPIVLSKTFLADNLTEQQFGLYAATTDISYKGFAFLNAAITMWAFPKLSKLYESQLFDKAKTVINFAISVYLISGCLIISVGVLLANYFNFDYGVLPYSGFMLIIFANFLWQAMSITHKPYELNIQTGRMVLNLFIGVVSFFLIYLFIDKVTKISVLYSVTIPAIIVASIYCFYSFRVNLKV
jgi:O-antigen/teichoic acid export membrane protein